MSHEDWFLWSNRNALTHAQFEVVIRSELGLEILLCAQEDRICIF